MISAILLAAGQSRRMGTPKMLLPWGNVTVIEHIISIFARAGIEDILVVTGGSMEQVQDVVTNCMLHYPVQTVFNENYLQGGMLSSLQCGLRALTQRSRTQDENEAAALIGLGDQPQVEEGSVRAVVQEYEATRSRLVVPSFQLRRGHPWLVAEALWDEILNLSLDQTARDFLNAHQSEIHYINLNTSSILADMDTPEDYHAARPGIAS